MTRLTCLFGLICGCFLFESHASPAGVDSAQYCVQFDYEQWRRDHPLPAGKRAASLNAGEPRTVRMIYFLPKDRPFRQEVVDSMRSVIRRTQAFYAEQMKANGYGSRLFQFERDANGAPQVHRVDGRQADSHYNKETIPAVFEEIAQVFDLSRNIYLVFIDNSSNRIRGYGGSGVGIGTRISKRAGHALVTSESSFFTAAHELGHAFGLPHDFRDGQYIMSYGERVPPRLSECSTRFLAAHPYFNPGVPLEEGSQTTVELLSAKRYPAGVSSVDIQLKLSNADGLHQAVLMLDRDVFACRNLTKRNEQLEFEFDGHRNNLQERSSYQLSVRVVNTNGDVAGLSFSLVQETVSSQIATLKAHGEGNLKVQFSPDGKTLGTASGSIHGGSGEVFLWDVQTRERIGVLNHESDVHSELAFSPDGRTLAAGISDGKIVLWDVANRKKIATLRGHTDWVGPLLFSPDGKTLASGGSSSGDPTARLWNVATRTETAILRGHKVWVGSLSFSPDGRTLATVSGGEGRVPSEEGKAFLWDVQTGELVSTLRHSTEFGRVAFSPDGRTGVSLMWDSVVLWDMSTRTEIRTLTTSTDWLFSLAFSPDGKILAFSSGHTVRLWNMGSLTQIASLAHPSSLRSVAISPDGRTLASGVWDGTVRLWNLPGLQPEPRTLARLSGDEQQGPAGVALAEPLMVLVRDQNGEPFAGAVVTFSVTAGGGALSTTTATSDAYGRAATVLMLGSQPGANTVVATVAGIEPVTFTATATAIGDFDGDGVVGFADFVLFAREFGLSSGDAGFDARFDLDQDGAVGFSDFVIFAGRFGQSA